MLFRIVAFLFFLTPLLEAMVLIRFSAGALIWVLISQLISGGSGVFLIRKYDFHQLFFLEAELRKKSPVVREMWDESMLISAAILLIIPGVFSDIAGILLLFPKIREWIVNQLFYDAY